MRAADATRAAVIRAAGAPDNLIPMSATYTDTPEIWFTPFSTHCLSNSIKHYIKPT
jgi:hypothetical protein